MDAIWGKKESGQRNFTMIIAIIIVIVTIIVIMLYFLITDLVFIRRFEAIALSERKEKCDPTMRRDVIAQRNFRDNDERIYIDTRILRRLRY